MQLFFYDNLKCTRNNCFSCRNKNKILSLHFELPEVETIAVKVNRTYADLIHGGEISGKSPFIESLTHGGYFLQIPRITAETFREWDKCSLREQLLSLCEQDYFIEENFYKRYPYPLTDKNIKKKVETLAYIVAKPTPGQKQ